MEKIAVQPSASAQTLVQNPVWYQALTLTERMESLRTHTDSHSAHYDSDSENAQRKLRRWKKQAPFNKGSWFAERLALDSITEDELLLLLAEPVEAVQVRISTVPDWLSELSSVFDDNDLADVPLSREGGETQHSIMFLSTIKPFLRRGLKRLHSGIQLLTQQYTHMPFDPATIASLLCTNLPQHILLQLSRTLVLELNVARLREHLQGNTPEERFHDFIQQLSCPSGILPMLEEYVVLARQLITTIDLWAAYSLEFLQHLCADWEDICQIFTPEGEPGVLVEVNDGAGDTHRGGRSVMLLKFGSGFQLVYKPKSLAIDIHFQELLAWLNERGYQPALCTLKLIDRGTYGWSEYIAAAECVLPAEVERFYERQGSYLALLYSLDAVDFHAENVIAAGEHPMLVDLEALFHPRVGNDDQATKNPSQSALVHSVWRIGLLPQRLWLNEHAEGIDISGLGGQKGQFFPQPLPRWESVGTDQMRRIRERIEMPIKSNRPRLNGQDVDTLNYSTNVVAGFTNMYRLLMKYRDEFAAEFLPRFAQDEIRFIARPTRVYALLLADSFHPNMLRNALDRDRLFDRLWIGTDKQSYLSSIIAAERDDLLRGDIPLFTACPASRDLFTSQNRRITNFFAEPSLELVKKRLQRLDEQDLVRQVWIIQATFTSMLMGNNTVARESVPLKSSYAPVTRERLIHEASALGDRLCDIAVRDGDAVGWLGLKPMNEQEWHLLPTETDLYSGVPGIALFLAYLGAVTGKARYIELAQIACKSVRSMLEQQKKFADFDGIGAFEGLGSSIYLFTHLSVLWQRPDLLHEAEELVELLPDLIEKDETFDVMSGSASCIASLLSLYAVAPSPSILEVAAQCGDHLLKHAQHMSVGVGWKSIHQQTPLTGFSHGAAGIALYLLRLAAASGKERFRRTALEAMAFERSLFCESQQNWPDLREHAATDARRGERAEGQEHSFMMAWCHGAPGIGLARLASLPYVDDVEIRKEIDGALKMTIAHGFGRNHSLCHGDCGNLETLLVAACTLDDPLYSRQLEHIKAALLESITTNGWMTGVPLGVETPDLMTGLAGIGYELLRLAYPAKVPSVLLFDAPTI